MCVKPFHILARRRVCAQVCGNVRGQQNVGVCQNQVVHSFFSPLVPVSPFFTSVGLNTRTHTFCLLQFNIKVFLMVQAITPSSCDSSSTRTDLFFDFFLGGGGVSDRCQALEGNSSNRMLVSSGFGTERSVIWERRRGCQTGPRPKQREMDWGGCGR